MCRSAGGPHARHQRTTPHPRRGLSPDGIPRALAGVDRRALPGARAAAREGRLAPDDHGRGRAAHGRRGQVPVRHPGFPGGAGARDAALRARAQVGLQRQGAARGHGPRGRRRADPVSHRRRPAPRPRVSRPGAAGGVLPRLQPLERRVLPRGAGAPALGGDAPAPGGRPGGGGGAPRRRGGRGGLLRAPEPGARPRPAPSRISIRSGPRSSGSAARSASTIRARRTCRRSASGWTRTPPATSSRIPSRRWPRWRA